MGSNSSSRSTTATLGRLELRCPPLPQTLVEAAGLIDEPELLEVGPVTTMVQRDPIVVAKLLHIVNSAYYGLRRTISSVERAVVMLGPVAVAGIVVGMNMLKLRSVLEGPGATSFYRLIRHSIATAYLARFLTEELPYGHTRSHNGQTLRVGATFTAGLLHDFGKIILVYNFPQEAAELYEKRTLKEQVKESDLLEMERLIFGCDHTEAGEFVARKLGFPDMLVDVIRLHHDPMKVDCEPETKRLIRATAVANLAANIMGHSLMEPVDWETGTEDPVWETFIDEDLPSHVTSESVVEALREQQEELDLYVETMMSAPEEIRDLSERLRR